jgi:hypothetical protein
LYVKINQIVDGRQSVWVYVARMRTLSLLSKRKLNKSQ